MRPKRESGVVFESQESGLLIFSECSVIEGQLWFSVDVCVNVTEDCSQPAMGRRLEVHSS